MKPIPATIFIGLSGRCIPIYSPTSAAINVEAMRAKDAPKKTSQNLLLLDEAKSTAICVLSPSSAKKTTTNVLISSFQFMVLV